MSLFANKELTSLEQLLTQQLRDLYDAERRLVDALPKMANAASCPDLISAIEQHRTESEDHVCRLETIFAELGEEPKRESCDAMKGLIKEAERMVDAKGDSAVRDVALIAALQRIEHYEMAAYGTARAFAQQLGREAVARILQQTLDEEGEADKRLTQIALSHANLQAARA